MTTIDRSPRPATMQGGYASRAPVRLSPACYLDAPPEARRIMLAEYRAQGQSALAVVAGRTVSRPAADLLRAEIAEADAAEAWMAETRAEAEAEAALARACAELADGLDAVTTDTPSL